MGSAGKPRAPSQRPVLSGLAVASDPIGFWEGVGPDCDYAVATPQSSTMSYARKKKQVHGCETTMLRLFYRSNRKRTKRGVFQWNCQECPSPVERLKEFSFHVEVVAREMWNGIQLCARQRTLSLAQSHRDTHDMDTHSGGATDLLGMVVDNVHGRKHSSGYRV